MDEGRDERGFLTAERVQGLFDRAVAHWNARRFFEAHEDWETIWHEAEGRRREWIQGLIQLAAAFHHVSRGTSSGFVKLVRSGSAKAEGYAGETHGLDFLDLWARLSPWRAHAERVAGGAPLDVDAPPDVPTLRYRPGVVPQPLPPEPEDGEDAGDDA
jgi:hypothetical protein